MLLPVPNPVPFSLFVFLVIHSLRIWTAPAMSKEIAMIILVLREPTWSEPYAVSVFLSRLLNLPKTGICYIKRKDFYFQFPIKQDSWLPREWAAPVYNRGNSSRFRQKKCAKSVTLQNSTYGRIDKIMRFAGAAPWNQDFSQSTHRLTFLFFKIKTTHLNHSVEQNTDG